MRKILLLFVLLTSASQAQCNYNIFPNDIYYAGQTVSIPTSSLAATMYLCGPGTVVVDTLDPVSMKARIVFVSSGSTYHYKSSLPANSGLMLWAKNGSTVVIYPGTTTGTSITIDKEPGATITNLSSGTITINNCTAITGLSISCVPTEIAEAQSIYSENKVWPNPSTGKLFINAKSEEKATVSLSVINQLGEIILSEDYINNGKKELSLEKYPVGIYFVRLKSGNYIDTRKVILLR